MTDRALHQVRRDAASERRRERARPLAAAIASAAVLAVVLVALVAGIRTASGRFVGSTVNEGSLLRAATVDVTLSSASTPSGGPASVTELAIDASNLLPGDVVVRCLAVAYRGDLDDVDVRMSGRLDGGSGLDRFLDASVVLGTGSDPGCSDFVPAESVFSGTLTELAEQHGAFPNGLDLLVGADDGDAVTVQVQVRLRDDDLAQGLDTGFWLVIEVQP